MGNPQAESRLAGIISRKDPAEMIAELERYEQGLNMLGYVLGAWMNRPDMVDWTAYEKLYDVLGKIEAGDNVTLSEPWISDPNGTAYEVKYTITFSGGSE